MVKKVSFLLLFSMAIVGFTFADGWYNGWKYAVTAAADNKTSEQFENWHRINLNNGFIPIKVPNSALEVINHALKDYRLDVGATFGFAMNNNPSSAGIVVIVRITNKNGAYEYYAYSG